MKLSVQEGFLGLGQFPKQSCTTRKKGPLGKNLQFSKLYFE